MSERVLIIGGGLGGLFSGAILAKEGMEVTVLEKNVSIGGGLQSFTRFGEVFDTGMHVLGGLQEGGNIRRLCQYLGIWDKVHVRAVPTECSERIFFAEDGRSYEIASGREGFVASLARHFPVQRDCLVRYVEALYRIVDEMDLFHLRPSADNLPKHSEEFGMPADAFIAKYISDRRLRQVVAYVNSLYGGRADETPAFVHAAISVLHINGTYRFAGGSHLFAETLADVIRNHGGSRTATNITGSSVNTLYQNLRNGSPQIVWATYNMNTPRTVNSWYINSTGKYFSYPRGTHVMVLRGYDANYVYFMDPYGGSYKTFSRSAFNSKYQLLGQQAILVK